MFISQPLVLFPSQFAKPAKQVKEQTPELQVVVAFARAGQTKPQEPQLLMFDNMATSQPSAAAPLQFAKPVLHNIIVQLPETHPIIAFGAEQVEPQFPQLFTLVLISISQPLAFIPSQFLNPVTHDTIEQTPATHAEVAFGSEHAFPHIPQFAKFVFRFTSHPSVLFPLQSAKPLIQVYEQIPD
jgi:hypothetical protein